MAKAKSRPKKSKSTAKAAVKSTVKKVVKEKPVAAKAPTRDDDYVVLDLTSLAVPVAILIGSVIIALALFFALKGNGGKRDGDTNTTNTTTNTVTGPYGQYSQYVFDVSGVSVDVKNDPTSGDAKSPVTLVEFSDFECPYCQRHFQQVDPDIRKNYINTGKVKHIFKNFVAVTQHNPAAQTEALAAACADEQGKFWSFHDELYSGTSANGQGYKGNGGTVDSMKDLAKAQKLNTNQFNACLTGRKYNAKYEKENQEIRDLTQLFPAAVQSEGVGTPTFMIYKTSDPSNVTFITGALPYDVFEQVFKKYL